MFVKFIEDTDQVESSIQNHFATIGWYTIFVFLVPYLLRHSYGFNSLRFYFPMIDLIANTFTSSGRYDRLFKDLYKLSPNNLTSFVSTNFINLIALVGVSWNGILHAINDKDIWTGVYVTLIMYTVTYLIPTQGIPLFVKRAQQYIDQKLDVDYTTERFHWEGYLGGFIVIVLLIIFEMFLIRFYLTYLD